VKPLALLLCAWVLWQSSQSHGWSVHSAWATRAECDAARAQTFPAWVKVPRPGAYVDITRPGGDVPMEGSRVENLMRWECLPDTIDPRK
jgi:hypothetical protein